MTETRRPGLLFCFAVIVGMAAVVVSCTGSDQLEPLEAVQITTPELEDIQPRSVASGDTLYIRGKYLNGGSANVNFSGLIGVLVLEDPAPTLTNSIAIVPQGLEPGDYDVRYRTYGRFSDESISITIRSGIASLTHDTAYVGQESIIAGTYELGANNYKLELIPTSGIAIEIPIQAVALSQLVWVVPSSLPFDRYRIRVTNLIENITLASRLTVSIQDAPADSSHLENVGIVGPTRTPDGLDQYRLQVAAGPDSVKGYNVLLVRPNANASSVIGITTRIDSVKMDGSTANVYFSARRDLSPGAYSIRVVMPSRTFWVYGGTNQIVIN